MNKETLGTLLALVTAVFSGIAIPANKMFIVSLDPVVFTAVRSIIIGTAFLLFAYWQWQRTLKKSPGKSSQKRPFITAPWKYLAGIAIIGGALAFLLYFTGLKLTTAGRAAFLHKTLPIFVAILAFAFLKEKITRRLGAAIVCMVAGSFAIYFAAISPTELWSNPQFGDVLILSAAFLWAVENVIARKAMLAGETNYIVSFSRMFFGGLVLFGALLLMGKGGALLALNATQLFNIGISTILLFCYVLFYYWSLRLINVSKAAVLLLLAPVISLVIGTILLGEPAPLQQLIGSALILAGAYLAIRVRSEQRGV